MNTEKTSGPVLVVGGSGGIGSAVCEKLAANGADVAFTYRSNTAAAEAVSVAVRGLGQQAWSCRADITDPAAVKAFVEQAVERLGPFSRVVYAGGPSVHMRRISELDPLQWSEVIDIDVKGFFNLVWATLPQLRSSGNGSLVALVSAAVDRVPARDSMSATPKAAIRALVRGIAKEEGRYGIRANCVAPGWIDAGLGRRAMQTEISPDLLDRLRQAIPLRRIGRAEDIAEAVAFLLSPAAAFITGQMLAVDGGGAL